MTREDLKVLNGRVATKEDADAGRSVFFVPDSRSVPYKFAQDLPLLAKGVRTDVGEHFPSPETVVAIVQAEQGDTGDVLLGIMYGNDEEGLCQLGEVEVIGPLGSELPHSAFGVSEHKNQ